MKKGDWEFKFERVFESRKHVTKTTAYYRGVRVRDIDGGTAEVLEELVKRAQYKNTKSNKSMHVYVTHLRRALRNQNIPYTVKTLPAQYALEATDDSSSSECP